MTRARTVFAACITVGAAVAGSAITPAAEITFYRLRAPGDAHDIEQASGAHYGRLGEREGLWIVCDRNGGRSAGKLYFFAAATLRRAKHRQPVVADAEFPVALPKGEWAAFARTHRRAGEPVLADIRKRIEARGQGGDGPFLDLEAVTIARSPTPPHPPRVFVVAEEPYSAVLELAVDGEGGSGSAWLAGVYRYTEAEAEAGWDHNDGLEGLAFGKTVGHLYWAEEGTKSHTDEATPRLMFQNPRVGLGVLEPGRLAVHDALSDALTEAVRGQRKGRMQTLNGLAVARDGRLLAVDRNGGWILRADLTTRKARRWLNLYDLEGTNLREALAEFPGPRKMPYISIEGIAVDDRGAIWLVDDPAMPEAFRASCLIRIARIAPTLDSR